MQNVSVFDFDGTLTTRDTLIEFIRFVRGDAACLLGFLLFSPLLVLMKLRLYPNGRAKERLFSYFFRGTSVDEMGDFCASFAKNRADLLRPKGLKEIETTLQRGDDVLVISASISDWVKPFFAHFIGVRVIGTELETENGKLTGRFSTPNCYGREKVVRFKSIYSDRSAVKITAYGDSKGDKEMLDYADIKHWKPFR